MIDVTLFGSRDMPLRPSSLPKLLACPMSVLLSWGDGSEGNAGSHTGSVVHHAVQAFHRVPGGDPAAAQEAMAAAYATFPEADRKKAKRWVDAYVADPTNLEATVVACELPVSLEYKGVFVTGTLDQIRQDTTGTLLVWDLKTGTSLLADDVVAEYQIQQAAYVLAANQTLKKLVTPGGIIMAAGYDKTYGRRFLPNGVTLSHCEHLMDAVVREVEGVRSGLRLFRPSAAGCRYCPHKPYPNCDDVSTLVLGASK